MIKTNALHLQSTISARTRIIAVDVVSDFLMYEASMKMSTWIIHGGFSQEAGAVRILKALFFSYYTKSPLMQLTRMGPLRDWPKLEGSKGVVVEKTS